MNSKSLQTVISAKEIVMLNVIAGRFSLASSSPLLIYPNQYIAGKEDLLRTPFSFSSSELGTRLLHEHGIFTCVYFGDEKEKIAEQLEAKYFVPLGSSDSEKVKQ